MNRETWLTNLWINNDESMYKYVRDCVTSPDDLSDFIEDLFLYSLKDDVVDRGGLIMDALYNFLGDVDYTELYNLFFDKK